jgi:hypothetical protein
MDASTNINTKSDPDFWEWAPCAHGTVTATALAIALRYGKEEVRTLEKRKATCEPWRRRDKGMHDARARRRY